MAELEGRAARAQNRAKASAKIERQIRGLICDIGVAFVEGDTLIVCSDLTEQRATIAQQEAKAGIEAYYTGPQAKRSAYLAFGKIWARLMAHGKFNVPPELPSLALPTPSSLFSPEWMEKARTAREWRDQLNKALQLPLAEMSRAALIDLTLVSAIFHGLLINDDHIVALGDALEASAIKMRRGYLGMIELLFQSKPKRGLVHRIIGEEGQVDITFVPDGITLGLILKALDREVTPRGLDGTTKTLRAKKSDIFERIRGATFGDVPSPAKIKSLRDLCAVGFWPRVSDGADLSHALLAAMTGTTPNIGPSLSPAAQAVTPFLKHEACKSMPVAPEASHIYIREQADQDVMALEGHIVLSVRRGSKRANNEALRNGLLEASLQPLSGSIARLLSDYLAKLVVGQMRKASTFHTYATRLLYPLAIAFGELDVRTLSSDDFEEMYRISLDQKLTLTSRNYCARVLAAMHSFGVASEAYQLPPLHAPLYEGAGGYTVVRAKMPSIQTIEAAKLILYDQGPKGRELALALTLAFRSGLRIGEIRKLRLSDVQIVTASANPRNRTIPRPLVQPASTTSAMADPLPRRASVWLWVRANKYGDNKTANARRKIPISALMSDAELNAFVAYLNLRNSGHTMFGSDLVFEADDTGIPFHPLHLGATLSKALRLASSETAWTVHHLRHAAFNAVHLVIEDEDELAGELFGWSEEQCTRVRRAIVGDQNRDVRAYHALAKFAGHASAGQTWASYLHLLPWLVALKREAIATTVPLSTLANVTGITSRTLREHEATFYPKLIRLLRPRVQKHLGNPVKSPNPTLLKQTKPQRPTDISLTLIEAVLRIQRQGASNVEAAQSLGVTGSFVTEIVNRALALGERLGARGNPRLADEDRDPETTTQDSAASFFPKTPRTPSGYQLATFFFKILTSDYISKRLAAETLETIINGINAHDPEIRFYDPDALRNVLKSLAQILQTDLLLVEIRRRPGRVHALALRRWRAAVGAEATIQETILPADLNGTAETEAGTALVRIKLPDDDIAKPARGTSALKYAAAMAWIVKFEIQT